MHHDYIILDLRYLLIVGNSDESLEGLASLLNKSLNNPHVLNSRVENLYDSTSCITTSFFSCSNIKSVGFPSLQAKEGRRPRPVVPGSLRAGCFSAGKI